MSRIGNRELVIPEGVTVTIENNIVTVKGPKGELQLKYDKVITVKEVEGKIIVERPSDIKHVKQLHGTTNALINNMIIGVTKGYEVILDTVGVGYRFALRGNDIIISAGYSHPVEMKIPAGITVTSDTNTELKLVGIDKNKLTEFAANVRKVREPEPYKGKGIRYRDEHIRRKEGKKAA